ncbi:MAG TPA: GTPase Era [Bacteroidia bacterium]|jgi:GTP-binding protein Era|nr:GTPase Era [Bacteroidia bacterium]
MHKAGFVNIIGNPNVGKSTLMNALVGERISIITSKAQTTRHRIMGIVNGEDFQVVYSDTPGIIVPKYKLQEGMMSFVGTALADADVLLIVDDLSEDRVIEEKTFTRIKESKVPSLIILNKTDLVSFERVASRTAWWKKEFPDAEIIPACALKGAEAELILQKIISMLPEHPPYFPKDELTDRPERFFVSEIVREKILLNFSQEIPYSCEVVVEDFIEGEHLVKIRANIFVSRESQKAILLGHKGESIKNLGIESRKDIEKFLQKKVYLELFVKVDKDWRDSERQLKRYGYL